MGMLIVTDHSGLVLAMTHRGSTKIVKALYCTFRGMPFDANQPYSRPSLVYHSTPTHLTSILPTWKIPDWFSSQLQANYILATSEMQVIPSGDVEISRAKSE
jgi:hypothetical protein